MTDSIAHNITKVRQRISAAEQKYLRNANSVQLMAVSKTRSAEQVRMAVSAGVDCLGENYLAEALEKMAALSDLAISWHFIGPIQSNKTRAIAAHFSWVHSVDRLKIATRLSQQRPAELGPLNICLQVNVSEEASKSGVALDQLAPLASQIAELPQLRLRGLMAIPAASADLQHQRQQFALLREAAATIEGCDTLSMGMSGDLEAAVAEGSTLVRVGTDIFGARG